MSDGSDIVDSIVDDTIAASYMALRAIDQALNDKDNNVGDGSPATAPPLAGALMLRGNRCVLTSSHFSIPSESHPLRSPKWPGMKIPAIEKLESESFFVAAMRSLTTLCDINPEEVRE